MKKGFTHFAQFNSIVTAMKTPIFFSCTNGGANDAIYYMSPVAKADLNGGLTSQDPTKLSNTKVYNAMVVPSNGKLKNFLIYLNDTQEPSGNYIYYLVVNNVNTGIGINFPANGGSIPVLLTDLVNEYNVSQGDLVAIAMDLTNTPAGACPLSGVFEFEPS